MKYTLSIVMIFSALYSSATPKDTCDWIFIYYAPYDNNLSQYSDSILNQLSTASQYENIRVVFQVDKADSLGMYRYSIGPNGTAVDTISSEESTSGKQLSSYLDWVNTTYVFSRSAVFFLDHGGGLNEVGQDLQPDSTYLKTQDIRKSLRRFNKKNKQQIDLLYLQVCAKASIEPLYELHDLAAYTLASQKLLGAPNYYYEGLFNYAHNHPELNGDHLGLIIPSRDRQDMFESLTCIDNSKFAKVKSDFKTLVSELNQRGEISLTRHPKYFDYSNDRYWDLIDFLDCLNLKTNEEKTARDNLKTSIQELIDRKYVPNGLTDIYCGISIAALSKDRIRAYWSMRFYRDFKMDRLPLE